MSDKMDQKSRNVKGIVHPKKKKKIMSSFTHPQVAPNLHWLTFHWVLFSHSMGHPLFNYPYLSKYHLLCSAEERNPYRFGTTCGWV